MVIYPVDSAIHLLNNWGLGPVSQKSRNFSGLLRVISSQRRGSKPSNIAILLVFLPLKTCEKITFSKQANCSLKTGFSGPTKSRALRETGQWIECSSSHRRNTETYPYDNQTGLTRLPHGIPAIAESLMGEFSYGYQFCQ